MVFMGVCAFYGDSDCTSRTTAECVPSYGGAHEEPGSSECLESPHSQGNHSPAFVTSQYENKFCV
jgi:hypothetical protein